MFDALKQLNNLRKLQGELEKQIVTVEKDGVKVTINGKMKVEEVRLNSALDHANNSRLVKEAINEAIEKLHGAIAGLMQR
ncbi:MAG: YbaB/EbfC family nucleoid-associated protein [bacterium]|nr:YbaB/EbfC family nucleoid-associated protein [bacterium]